MLHVTPLVLMTVEGLYIHDIAEIRPPTENSFTFRVC
jgi:hypothetical protein